MQYGTVPYRPKKEKEWNKNKYCFQNNYWYGIGNEKIIMNNQLNDSLDTMVSVSTNDTSDVDDSTSGSSSNSSENNNTSSSDDDSSEYTSSSSTTKASTTNAPGPNKKKKQPSLEPYIAKLERFELFSTSQAYYLVGSDKEGSTFRVLVLDRTRMTTTTENGEVIFQRLGDFCREDPTVYTAVEIRNVLDMIHDGNHELEPIGKAFGIVGFIRFLDCYYLTLITKRAKVGSIGCGNDVYSIRATETFPLKPAEKTTPSITSSVLKAPHHSSFPTTTNTNTTHYPSSTNPITNSNTTTTSSTNPTTVTKEDPSSVLLNMWNRGKRSVGLGFTNSEMAELRYQGLYQVMDLTKNNFFFSYTYDITKSLQDNFLAMQVQPFPPPPFQEMYAWNYFLTRELEEEDIISKDTQHYWVLPIIHGAFVQRTLQEYGQRLVITLLARRSRHFAGTRYLKRGVSDAGKVANDVEHEQIVFSQAKKIYSSYLQVRGSIPTFWTQETSVTMPKPPIILSRVDPTYQSTQFHMQDLLKRYGSPIVILDLVKQSEKREREVIVGNEFRHAIQYLNSLITPMEYKIRYCALDYSHISKHRNLNVSTSLNEAATWAVNQTGFFCSQPIWKIVENQEVEPFHDNNNNSDSGNNNTAKNLGLPVFAMEQKGILRTNCIDCLDRTNVAQFSAGVEALGQQLVVMGVRTVAKLESTSSIVKLLIDMYVEIGDHIALQYGGSEAHKKVNHTHQQSISSSSNSSIHMPMGKHKELLTSIRRYYSNAFTDQAKQDAMNLFLGYYIPSVHAVPLWDMENDYYLHNFHVKEGRGSLPTMKKFQQQYAIITANNTNELCTTCITNDYTSGMIEQSKQRQNGSDDSSTSDDSDGDVDVKLIRKSKTHYSRESREISRVRLTCQKQNESLSEWWKYAVHQYIQQRMWMQLGKHTTEDLPPRFERLYQPDKLSQFDKLFARNWATPIRLATTTNTTSNSVGTHINTSNTYTNRHSTINSSAQSIASSSYDNQQQHSQQLNQHRSTQHQLSTVDQDTELLLIRRRVTSSSTNHYDEKEEEDFTNENTNYTQTKQNQTLENYLEEYGFEAATKPTLPLFMESKLSRRYKQSARKNWSMNCTYLGNNSTTMEQPCQEFIDYANPMDYNPISPNFRQKARDEFIHCLHDTSLHSDDVAGIEQLSESAHIGNEIRTGPYRGLSQHESAMDVTTVIYEQFDTLGNVQKRGGDGLPSVTHDLKRRQMDTPGVMDAVFHGWDRFSAEEKAYAEIMDTSSMSQRRSDFTDSLSLSTYCTFFEHTTPLTDLEKSYLNGTNLTSKQHTPSTGKSKIRADYDDWTKKGPRSGAFAKKAAAMGIPTPFSSSKSSSNHPPKNSHSLYGTNYNRIIPPGFEQINDDMYARKDNRFMVFNSAGLEAWNGRVPDPKTKVNGIEEDILIR